MQGTLLKIGAIFNTQVIEKVMKSFVLYKNISNS